MIFESINNLYVVSYKGWLGDFFAEQPPRIPYKPKLGGFDIAAKRIELYGLLVLIEECSCNMGKTNQTDIIR